MIVAGIGCRKGVGVDEVLAAIDSALAEHGLTRDRLAALATTAFKKGEAAIFAAGRELALKVVVLDDTAEQHVVATAGNWAAPTLTCSALSLVLAGTPSVAESAALAAAGPSARLLGPRTVLGRVTCAIAIGREP